LLKSSTPQEVEDALDDLPKSDELYQTIFRRLREKWELPGNRQWAKRILTLVCFSEIKFAPRHLLYMVGLDLNDPRVNHTNLLDPSLITSLCDGLVTIHVKTELVDLVHIQAKKFFIENQEDYFPDAHHDIAERYTAHVMAMSSIGFIENHDLGDMSKLAVKNLGPQVRQHLVQNLPGRFKNQRRMTSQSITATNAAALTSDPELRLSDERNEALFHKIAVMIDDPDCAAIICQVFCEISTWRPHQGTNPSEPNNALPTWKLLGWTRLHIAAAMGLVDVTRRFLDDTTLLNTVDFLGKTAVAVAVDRQHPDVAEVLVHAGAKVDIFSATGQTILLTAVGKGNVEFARRTLMSSESTTPWTRLLTGVRKEDKDLRLLLATLDGEATKVGRICAGSSVAMSSAAATALLLAADCGHLDILKILLAAAVPVDSRDGEGRTALHRAARRNDHAMVETLLDHSADVDAKSMFGQTAWTEIVAFPEHEDMVKLLVGRATNINVAHQDGVSSLYISAAGGHIALVSRLLSVGADPSIRTVYGWTPLVCRKEYTFMSERSHIRTEY
jgi:ankyrin repeat protein